MLALPGSEAVRPCPAQLFTLRETGIDSNSFEVAADIALSPDSVTKPHDTRLNSQSAALAGHRGATTSAT